RVDREAHADAGTRVVAEVDVEEVELRGGDGLHRGGLLWGNSAVQRSSSVGNAARSVKIHCTVPSSQKRKYELRRRAEGMEDTRRRIAEAAMELHGSVGPARTSLSAVAERAGVQRHTLYRHFPTEDALYTACSGMFAAEHPRPELGAWREIDDPEARLSVGLGELYRWYEENEPMLTNLYRDRALVE